MIADGFCHCRPPFLRLPPGHGLTRRAVFACCQLEIEVSVRDIQWQEAGCVPAGAAYRTRTGPSSLEGCCATTTQMLQISGLSRLSCVADFRIATVFTLRRSRSFPAVWHKKKEGDSLPGSLIPDGGRHWIRTNYLRLCLPVHIRMCFPPMLGPHRGRGPYSVVNRVPPQHTAWDAA